jgi:hypothetical protein
VNYLQSGGVIEDDSTGAAGSDYWFNAQGTSFSIKDHPLVQAKTTLNTPSTAVVQTSTTTRVVVDLFVNSPTSLPCGKIVGGTQSALATVQVSEGNTGTAACTSQFESPMSFVSSVFFADSGNCILNSTCSGISLVRTYGSAPRCFAVWDKNVGGTFTGLLGFSSTTSTVTFSDTVGGDTGTISWFCIGN